MPLANCSVFSSPRLEIDSTRVSVSEVPRQIIFLFFSSNSDLKRPKIWFASFVLDLSLNAFSILDLNSSGVLLK